MSFTVQLDNGAHGEIEFFTYTFTFLFSVVFGMIFGTILNEYFMNRFVKNFIEINKSLNSELNSELNTIEEEMESEMESETESEVESETEENICDDCVQAMEAMESTKSPNCVESFKFTCSKLPQTASESLNLAINIMKELGGFSTDIGERMKYYETHSEEFVTTIDKNTEFVVRLDGRGFSNLFHSLKNDEFQRLRTPFLNDFKLAMDLTTADLVKTFTATTGYNHSDEISLHFKIHHKDDNVEREHLFKGRVVKLLTLLSSHASVKFQKYLREQNPTRYAHVLDRLTFDARHIIFPSEKEVMNYFVWRSQFDCYRNFVSELAYRYFSKKSLEKQSTKERKLRLLDEAGVDVDSFNVFLRHGTFVKRALTTYNENNNTYYRNKYVRFALPELKCEKVYYDLVESKNFDSSEYTELLELVSELTF